MRAWRAGFVGRPREAPSVGRARSLRARLVLFTTGALVVVCTAMVLTTVLVQRAHLLGELDQRVRDAAARSQGGLERRTGSATDLGFLNERGQPTGTVAARLTDGEVVAAERVTADGRQQVLTAVQRAALAGITADGTLHTRTIPGLGTYRIAAAEGDGPAVLAGLPMADVQDSLHDVIVTEAVIGTVGLAGSAAVCAIVIRRRLRPLGRVAATAVEVARAPLDRGEVTGLTRVPAADTDPATEAGQVGAALNHLIDRVESALAGRQRSEERMRRFLADAGHELRTPLASIAGYAELMDRGALADTYVTWAGGTADDSAFYVRVHSPVVWVEVDCQGPGPLAGAYGAKQGDGPTQKHVHSVIRTPNGNDYGKELLRQHYLTSPHHR